MFRTLHIYAWLYMITEHELYCYDMWNLLNWAIIDALLDKNCAHTCKLLVVTFPNIYFYYDS